MATNLDAFQKGAGPCSAHIPLGRLFGRRDRRQCRRCQSAGRIGLHKPAAQQDGRPPRLAEPRFHQFDRAARPDHRHIDADRIERKRTQYIIGQTAETQYVAAAASRVIDLQHMRHQPQYRGDMLLLDIPRPADMRAGLEMMGVDTFKISHGHSVDLPLPRQDFRSSSASMI